MKTKAGHVTTIKAIAIPPVTMASFLVKPNVTSPSPKKTMMIII